MHRSTLLQSTNLSYLQTTVITVDKQTKKKNQFILDLWQQCLHMTLGLKVDFLWLQSRDK